MSLNKEKSKYIETLYYEMFYQLLAYAQSALSDRSLAEEAIQDTFGIACAKIEDLTSSPNPKGWIMNTLKYVIKNMRRTRAQLNQLLIPYIAHEAGIAGAKYDDDLTDITYGDIIGSKDYDLLKKIVIEKYSMVEAANEICITVEACKKRVQRAKKKLQKALKEK